MTLQAGTALLLASGAVCTDLSMEKIPNGWLGLGWLSGLLIQTTLYGEEGYVRFIAGVLLSIGMLIPLYVFRMLGAGDIKLLGALAGIQGWEAAGIGMLLAFFLGAVIAAAFLIFCGNLEERIRYFIDYTKRSLDLRKVLPYRTGDTGVEMLHFTVPVLLEILVYAGGGFG